MPTKTKSSSKSSSRSSSKTASRSAAKPKGVDLVEAVEAADPNEVRAARALVDAENRAEAYESGHKAGAVHGYAVYDHDARQIAQVFNAGDDKANERDAAGYMGRLLGKTGEATERHLSLVKLVEA